MLPPISMTSAILLGILSTSDLRRSETAVWDLNGQSGGGGGAVGGDEAEEGTLRQLEAGPDGSQTGLHPPQHHNHPFFLLGPLFCSHLGDRKNRDLKLASTGKF